MMPLSEVVIFDADTNEIIMLEEDLTVFPAKLTSKLKRKLRHLERASGDYVSRQFLNALADIMGGYRDALKFMEKDDVSLLNPVHPVHPERKILILPDISYF